MLSSCPQRHLKEIAQPALDRETSCLEAFQSNSDVFAGSNAVIDDFLVAIRFDTNGNIDSFTFKGYSTQRNAGSVQINAEELVTEFALMIGLNFWNYLLGDVRYLSWAVMAAIHLFNQVGYFSGGYAFRVKLDDHIF